MRVCDGEKKPRTVTNAGWDQQKFMYYVNVLRIPLKKN